MKIQCPGCKRIVAETTDRFNPDVRPNGSMLEIAEPYKSRGWGQMMAWTIGTCCAELFCPCCNYPLAPSGRFTLLGEPEIVEQVPISDSVDIEIIKPASASPDSCPKCGREETEFKNRSGFVNHCRKCGTGKINEE